MQATTLKTEIESQKIVEIESFKQDKPVQTLAKKATHSETV